MEKQYFDFLELADGYIWAVDVESGSKTPVDTGCTGYSVSSCNKIELVIQQSSGGWWYRREKFELEKDVKEYISYIHKMMGILEDSKWSISAD
ncbi:hypothetical protein [Oceanimonas sp. GK1]|uniref:hypothetical protein n=1 Tax=Oceanimonas sp. (strain GK1 / IBRC-M 10197) TaxID=511062 RepID=UPI0011D289CA|nr:hypothetical protein [Oceanimonas sp. GK1]